MFSFCDNLKLLLQMHFNSKLIKKIYIDQLKRLCFTFIWGKRDRIRRNTLIAPVSEGGINMLDIESFFLALKAAGFKRIILNNEDYIFIPRNMFRNFCDNLKYVVAKMHI